MSRIGKSLGAFYLLLLLAGCERNVQVTEKMTWECLDSTPESEEARTQIVRFFFEKTPNYFVTVASKNLCDSLKEKNKKTVEIRFLVWGVPGSSDFGFVETSIDGAPIQLGLGTGGMGRYGDPTALRDPLTQALRKQR